MTFPKWLHHIFGIWGVYIILSGLYKMFIIGTLFYVGKGSSALALSFCVEAFWVGLAYPFMIKPSLNNIKAMRESDSSNSKGN